jgi:hypothetical protein
MQHAGEMSLASSLQTHEGWPSHYFEHAGPNAPYVQIGYSVLTQRSVFNPLPIFDRWICRRHVPIKAHLARFVHILICSSAYAEIADCRWLPNNFPLDTWLSLADVAPSTCFGCIDQGNFYEAELGALCLGEGVRLAAET